MPERLQGGGEGGWPAASWAVLRCRKSPGASVVYPVGRQRRRGHPGSPVPPPLGGCMARARPVLRMPGLGAGRRRRPGSRGGASRQLQSCFLPPPPPPRSLPRARLPKPRDSAWGRVLGRNLAYSQPAGRTRPCPGLAATCRGLRPLPLRAKLCRLSAPRAGSRAAQLLQRDQPAERGRGAGEGKRRLGPAPRPLPRPYPRPPRGWRSRGGGRGRVTSLVPPLSVTARDPPTRSP